ncbi:MAG: hypothetical protein J7513_08425 [Solirubrobacteraceae bacterium]|nr:hypothetical protein [Solirubrobacteraceae bacterium]
MPRRALSASRRRPRLTGAIVAFSLAPVTAFGVAALTCDCPEHQHGSTVAAHATHPGVPGAAAIHAMNARWIVRDEPTATRLATVITTREATTQLSKRCRTLIKAKRSRLTTTEKHKRLGCVRERRAIVQRSIAEATGQLPATADLPTGSPTPTPAPGSTPAPGASPTPMPTATPAPRGACASVPNAVYAAVGVDAFDDGTHLYFQLTRGSVTADCVSFELRNHDSQAHNLYVQEKGRPSTAKPVIANLAPGAGGTVTRATAELKLDPGTYTLRCVIPGHEAMTVDFTVVAPR